MKKALILTIFSPVISFSWVIPLIPNGPFLKTSKNSFVDLNFAMQSWMQLDGKVVNNDQNSTNFAVRDARIIMNGQINKYIQFGSLFDFADNNLLGFDGSARRHQATTTISDIQDAFINFTYNNKVNFTMGLFRDPLDRITLTGIYTTVIPTLYGYGIGPIDKFFQVPFINPMFPLSFGSIPANPAGVQDPFRDVGAALWGNINKGMFKYYFQVGNGKYDYQSSSSSEDPFKTDKSNLKYTFRLTFTPTFLGYKADQDYMVKDTYLGSMNTLTIGIGYSFQKRECSGSPNSNCINPQNSVLPAQSVTSKAFAADIFWEQKFGDFVPNLQVAYIDQKDLGFGDKYGNKPEASAYYINSQLLYKRYVGIGMPAIAFKIEEYENKNLFAINKNGSVLGNPNSDNLALQPGFNYSNAKIYDYTLAFNYYLAMQAAKVSLGVDFINPSYVVKQAECKLGGCGKSFTDYTLSLQVVF